MSTLGTIIGLFLLAIIVLAFWLGSDGNIDEMHRMEREHDEA